MEINLVLKLKNDLTKDLLLMDFMVRLLLVFVSLFYGYGLFYGFLFYG